jgi:hypothetical protein
VSLKSSIASKLGAIILVPTYKYVAETACSERKWKEKLKEWKFDKNISATNMSIVVAKAEKRAREEGKETVFFHGDCQISPERIQQFKRRKTSKIAEAESPAAGI